MADHAPAAPAAPRDERFDLTAPQDGERLDRFLAERSAFTRTRIQQLIEEGAVRVNGRAAKPGLKLMAGDRVEAHLFAPAQPDLTPQPMAIPVVYEDADVLVVDKPPDLTVHPAPGHPDRTLVNALLAHVPALRTPGGGIRPGIVHRLDKDTSGLMMVAKHPVAQESLSAQIAARKILKRYYALVEGRITTERGLIEAPIGRDPGHRQRMAVVNEGEGKEAYTRFRVLHAYEHMTLIEAEPVTGRTHQIRVHLAASGHAIAGDDKYGDALINREMRGQGLRRMFLHASRLEMEHPLTRVPLILEAPLPPELESFLRTGLGCGTAPTQTRPGRSM